MRLALVASSLLIACTAATSTPSAPETAPTAPTAIAPTYPLQFPVLDEAELGRRTAAAEALSPEWRITLNPLGFLSSARLGRPMDPELPHAEAHAKVVGFLEKQHAITGLDGPNIKKNYDNEYGALYQQTASSGAIGHLDVSYPRKRPTIGGHLWPVLPPDGPLKSDAELEAKVKALDPTPNLTVQHGYRHTAPSAQGPYVIREAVCGYSAVDVLTDRKLRPRRPCFDARTGEDITAQLTGMSIASSNGVITERRLAR